MLAPTCHLALWKSVFKCQIVFQVVLLLELCLNPLKYFGVCPRKIELCVLIGHHRIIISHLLWYDLLYLLYFARNIIKSI